MSSWNRRVAAISRHQEKTGAAASRQSGDGEAKGRLESLGLPSEIHPDDALTIQSLLRIADGRKSGFESSVVARILNDDGETEREVRVMVVGNGSGSDLLIGNLDHECSTDPHTGLPGRPQVLEFLKEALQHARALDGSVACYSIDIDRFKTINDTDGYEAGEQAVRQLATEVSKKTRTDEMLARIGGDELAIVCPDVCGPAEAIELGERFRSAVDDAPVDSPLWGATVSIGIALASPESTAEQLFRDSETALYQAKGQGRDRCELFTEDLRTESRKSYSVRQKLRNAIHDDTVGTSYQPIIDLASSEIVGCEALLRITDADGRPMLTREAIAAAEEGGLIRRVENIVLEQSSAAISSLNRKLETPLFVSLNVSGRRVNDSRFPLEVAQQLHQVEVPPEHINLELHPDVLRSKESGKRLVTQLRSLGVVVVVDEFLGHEGLENIDGDLIDWVKLDKRLVHGIHGARGKARAKLLIEAMTERGIKVCAVGIESDADLEVVTELGCSFAQGYKFSPPVDADQLGRLVAEQSS